jgi:hypothetical protein
MSNAREKIAIIGLVAIALASLWFLKIDSKDILVAVVSGLLGYLRGNATPPAKEVTDGQKVQE